MRFETIRNYIEVLKPRETGLLTFIGVCSAVIAGNGQPPLARLILALVTILIASAGANGLTNYLDRNVDGCMERTRHRALPSKRIYPPQKVLPLTIGLTVIGLGLAWQLHPIAFISDIIGTTAAVVWRKRITCVFPQGALASVTPVIMGWFAIRPTFGWEILLLSLLIAAWLPLHVWSIMIAHRQDYLNAGLKYFPMSWQPKESVKVLLLFSLVLGVASISLYFVGGFTLLYLMVAIILSAIMIYACVRLVIANTNENAWKLYKLSAFPYLGLIFLAMTLDIWLL
ncbi:MAG: UbiA family prenyltransferase [Chloroflexota bacterium]